MSDLIKLRSFLKAYSLNDDDPEPSDQQKKYPQPPLEKPFDPAATFMDLPPPDQTVFSEAGILNCINHRISRRKFSDQPIDQQALSFLLWATQGVKHISQDRYYTKRTVPSAGARHPFETYLAVIKVDGLNPGIYRYIALQHKLIFIHGVDGLETTLTQATLGQTFCGRCAVVFFWAALPYRMEWRYRMKAAKAILLDAGHLAQNLYLACEALGLGTCGIGAYIQESIDEMLGIDGENELVVYLAPVGYPEIS